MRSALAEILGVFAQESFEDRDIAGSCEVQVLPGQLFLPVAGRVLKGTHEALGNDLY